MKLQFVSFSLLICCVSASLNNIALQAVLGPHVLQYVRKNCPELSFKLDGISGKWKGMKKELARNRIRDLSRFEVDESTIQRYGAWACSPASGRRIIQFPDVNSLSPVPVLKVNDETEDSPEDLYKENYSLDLDPYEDHYQASTGVMHLGTFLFGLVLGGAAVQIYNSHSSEVKIAGNKALRRPEL